MFDCDSPDGMIRVRHDHQGEKSGKISLDLRLPKKFSLAKLMVEYPHDSLDVLGFTDRYSSPTMTEESSRKVGLDFAPLSMELENSKSVSGPAIRKYLDKSEAVFDGKQTITYALRAEIDEEIAKRFIGSVYLGELHFAFLGLESCKVPVRVKGEITGKSFLSRPSVSKDKLDVVLEYKGYLESLRGIAFDTIERETHVFPNGDGTTYFRERIKAAAQPIDSITLAFKSNVAKFPPIAKMIERNHFKYGSDDPRRVGWRRLTDSTSEKSFVFEFKPAIQNETFDVWYQYTGTPLFCKVASESMRLLGDEYEGVSLDVVSQIGNFQMKVVLEEGLGGRVEDLHAERKPANSPTERIQADDRIEDGRRTLGVSLKDPRNAHYAIKWRLPA